MAHRLAYVVPTKDRPDDLRKMLQSLVVQTRLPEQVIVVDGSSDPIDSVLKEFASLPLTYVRCFPPGLAKQRNAGMAHIREHITLAGYLDDDLVLESHATERLLSFFESAPADVGGVAFSIINQLSARPSIFTKIFGINSPIPGKMLSSGFQSQIPFIEKTSQTDWLYGGATIWRREVIREFSYDEWYIGTGYLEDVDYSYRVRGKYRLFVLGDARTYHFSRTMPLNRNYLFGRHQISNRIYFVRKLGNFSNVGFAWALIGQFLHNLLSSVVGRNSAGVRRALGNLRGLWDIFGSGAKQISGHYK